MYQSRGLKNFIRTHPVIFILVGINILFFLFITLPIFPNRWIAEKMIGVNILIANGEWWRLVTPIFIHSNFNHLLFNCISLVIIGSLLEERKKKSTFLLVYLSSGIFANVFTYIFAPLTFIHIGASGAVFGLLGVFAMLIYLNKLPYQLKNSLLVIIILALLFTFMEKNTNIYAHIGGFLWGCLCGFLIIRKTI